MPSLGISPEYLASLNFKKLLEVFPLRFSPRVLYALFYAKVQSAFKYQDCVIYSWFLRSSCALGVRKCGCPMGVYRGPGLAEAYNDEGEVSIQFYNLITLVR